jgi:Condensation domain
MTPRRHPSTYSDALSGAVQESAGSLGEAQFCFPTTRAQQALWYLDRLEPGDPAWNIAVRFRLRGPLDVPTLERAINEVVRRHEILRTTFSFMDHAPVQIIHENAFIPLPVDDLIPLSREARDSEEERRTIAEGSLPFDLKTGPLLRTRLLRLAERDHMLLLTIHHIVSDGWSIGVFSDEIAAHYQSFLSQGLSSAPPLPLQYADYAVWLKGRDAAPALDEHRAYWQGKLANLPLCEIPTDHPRPQQKTHNGYILSLLLPVALTDSLKEFCASQGCTFFTLSLAVLNMLIARCTSQTDICVGTLVAGRDQVELEPLIGLFTNTVVLRVDLSGNPLLFDLLSRVRQTLEEALAHQDLHFQQVIEALRLKRDPSRPVLYSINFIYQRDFVKPLEFAGLTMTPVPAKSPGAIHDLNFFMVERAEGWRLSCEFNYDLYDAVSVNRLLGQLRVLFEEIARDPHRRISDFPFPQNVGEPLPSFVPRTSRTDSRSARISGNAPEIQPLNAANHAKKLLNRAHTHFGKN